MPADYRARLIAKADLRSAAVLARERKTYARMARYQFGCEPKFLTLVNTAATLRGITTAAYIRRAIAAFVAADLDMALADVAELTPAASRRGTRPSPGAGRRVTADNGKGFGPWRASSIADAHPSELDAATVRDQAEPASRLRLVE
jgi:hypothetical protein